MSEPTPVEPLPPSVVAFILPGIGHYLPIASLIQELDPPGGAVIVAEVPEESALRDKVVSDGFTYVSITSIAASTSSARGLRSLARLLRTKIAPRLAARGKTPIGLPSLPARFAFAMGTQVLPIPHTTPAAGEALGRIIDEAQPQLILAEYDSPWFDVLLAERAIPQIRYTICPVGSLQPGRPATPAGLDPALPGAQRLVNRINSTARRIRMRRSNRVFRKARAAYVAQRGGPITDSEPLAHVAFTTRSLDDYPQCPQERYRYAGASLYRLYGEVTTEGDRDTILVTWGSAAAPTDAAVLTRLLPALAGFATTMRVAIQTSDPALRERIAEASADIVLLDRAPTPLYDEYRRARVVIGHGGYGTIIESLCFGAPVLTIPLMGADRLETGQRVIQSGAGLTLDRYTFRADDATEAIDRLLNEPSFVERARAVGADLVEPGPRRALLGQLHELLDEGATR